eukprot:1234513-Rhodomonas_salina.1
MSSTAGHGTDTGGAMRLVIRTPRGCPPEPYTDPRGCPNIVSVDGRPCSDGDHNSKSTTTGPVRHDKKTPRTPRTRHG